MPFRSPVARRHIGLRYIGTRSYRLGRSAVSPSVPQPLSHSLSTSLSHLAGGWIQFMILEVRIVGSFTGSVYVCECVCMSAAIYYIILSYHILLYYYFWFVFCRPSSLVDDFVKIYTYLKVSTSAVCTRPFKLVCAGIGWSKLLFWLFLVGLFTAYYT